MTTPPPRLHRDELAHPARKGTRVWDAALLWSLPRVGGVEVSPSGGHLAVPVTRYDVENDVGAARIWLIPTEGGIGRPLTSPERDASAPRFSPDGRRLAFVARPTPRRGETPEPAQLHVLPLEGGEAEAVTDLPLGVFDPQWLPDGSGLVFGAYLFVDHLDVEGTKEEVERRREDPVRVRATEDRLYKFWDRWLTGEKAAHLFLLDAATREVRDLMPGSRLHFDWMDPTGSYEIAPSGREIVFTAIREPMEGERPRRDLFRLAFSQAKPAILTANNPADSLGARYAPDGETVVFGMTEDPTFYADRVRLMGLHLPTGDVTPILPNWDRSPADWRFTRDGALVFHAEDEGEVRLFRLDPDASGDAARPTPITRGGSARQARPAPDGTVYCLHDSLSSPPEVKRVAPDGGFEDVTRFADEHLRDVAFGEVRSLTFEGAHAAEVQAYLILPPHHAPGQRHPLVHLIHGGPHGTFGDTWHWRWHAQTFAARGYVVACVNFQGSTSWGDDFARRIQGAWGDRPAGDVLRATDVLVASGRVDEGRMAITGGSYGGYLTAWLASTTSRFQCAVNHAGVYDLTTQWASDWTFSWPQAAGGAPWDDPAAADRWDPARHSQGLETPMLVIHGEKDYRVPADQARVCYGILKAKGVPARLLIYEDENHWILKPRNSLRWYREVFDWLARFLDEGRQG